MPTILHRPVIFRHRPASVPLDQNRAEVRILWSGMMAFFIAHLLEPASYAAGVGASTLYKVVALTHHPRWMLALMFLCALSVVPHLLSLIFLPSKLNCMLPRRMACAGAAVAAITWFYLGNLARPLDFGILPYIYVARAILDLGVALALAFSLNAQMIREGAVVPHE